MILQVAVNPPIKHPDVLSGISVASVGMQGVEHITQDGELVFVTFKDGSVYEVRQWGWIRRQDDREKARREVSEASTRGAKEASAKKVSSGSRRTPVRSSKKVRKKPSKAKGSKLQPPSGEDVRPSVSTSKGRSKVSS